MSRAPAADWAPEEATAPATGGPSDVSRPGSSVERGEAREPPEAGESFSRRGRVTTGGFVRRNEDAGGGNDLAERLVNLSPSATLNYGPGGERALVKFDLLAGAAAAFINWPRNAAAGRRLNRQAPELAAGALGPLHWAQ